MSDDATPRPPIGRPPRGPKYPAAIPRVMTTTAQRALVDAYADEHELTIGEAVRALITAGFHYQASGGDI